MNRYLLAGCAAVALAMGAGAANAQAKFEVKIGGDAFFEAGYVEQDRDAATRSTDFRNRFRVTVIPTAKADNGLEYGGRIRMRAANADRTMDADRAFIFAQGTFGQVQLGVTNSFNDQTFVSAPQDYLPLGIYDAAVDWISTSSNNVAGTIGGATAPVAATGGNLLTQSINSDRLATKIVYITPRFAGLQLGASYTPRNDDNHNSVNRNEVFALPTVQNNRTFTDIVEVGANYSNTFAGFAVKASAGYFWGDGAQNTTVAGVTSDVEDLRAWQAGAQVGYAGFALGGAYVDYGDSGLNKRIGVSHEKTRTWVVGAQYTTGPIVVGANYKNGQDAGLTTVAGKRKLEVYEIGAGYTVAPGMTVQAQYDYFDADSDVNAADDKGHLFLVRSVLAF